MHNALAHQRSRADGSTHTKIHTGTLRGPSGVEEESYQLSTYRLIKAGMFAQDTHTQTQTLSRVTLLTCRGLLVIVEGC